MIDSAHPLGEETATTHERLLNAAAALFAERGYGGTSMADIAAQVGVRKASLYNYYPSKEEILMHLLRQGMQAWQEACGDHLRGDAAAGERLWRHLSAAVRFAGERPEKVAIFRVAATQIGGELGDRAMTEVSAFKRSYRDLIEAFFARAIATGEVRADASAADLGYAFRVFFNGVITSHISMCDDVEQLPEARLRRVWELFWNGMASDAGHEERA